MTTRPFVINREVVMTEPHPEAMVLADLRKLLSVIEMPDYDEFPNTQAEIYAMMVRYDSFPIFFDDSYHQRYGGRPA